MASLRCSAIALALCAVALPVALSQPFTVTPNNFAPGTTEARLRQEANYTGFVFDFDTARVRRAKSRFRMQ